MTDELPTLVDGKDFTDKYIEVQRWRGARTFAGILKSLGKYKGMTKKEQLLAYSDDLGGSGVTTMPREHAMRLVKMGYPASVFANVD